jgi:hypothetical protein
VETRCFFLFSGQARKSGQTPKASEGQQKQFAVTVDIFFKNPDDREVRCKADVNIKLNSLVMEQCQDILVSLAEVVPDFGTISVLDDLYTNKLLNPGYHQPSLQRLLKQ